MKRFSTRIAYFVIVLMGSAILLVNINEYQNAHDLIDDNKSLIEKTILKTLSYNLKIKSLNFPTSASEINKQWKKLTPNFSVYENGRLIYPLRFTGFDSKKLSSLWQLYNTDNMQPQTTLIPANSRDRINALSSIKISLSSNIQSDKEQLGRNIKKFFNLVENFQLEPLEEIISMLSFLKSHEKSRWNEQLIKTIIFDGSTQFKPIIHYLFRKNSQLSKADATQAFNTLRTILEQTNIDLTWFHLNEFEFFKDSFKVGAIKEDDILFSNNRILFRLNDKTNTNESILILPINISNELINVKNILVKQAILEHSDTITLNDIQSLTSLENLGVNLNRVIWNQQRAEITKYFIFKLSFTLLFVIALFVMVFFISLQNRRKLEHINLKENFLNLVSHELRTPLASIRLMTETLQKRNERSLDIKNYPAKIIDEVDRLWIMVDNLLSLNQIKSGELNLNIDKVKLLPLINRVVGRLQETSNIEIDLTIDIPHDYTIQVDQTLFELVIVNLLSNAIKYCNNKICEVNVFIDNEYSSIKISDNACGIEKNDWFKVFEDFYRVKQENSIKGTGIGLSLCAQILKLHQGSITIIQSDSNGTTWELKLPDSDKGNKIE